MYFNMRNDNTIIKYIQLLLQDSKIITPDLHHIAT